MKEDIQQDDDGVKVTTKVGKIEQIDEAIFVMGHPRSGTSASCQLMNATDKTEWLLNTQSDDRNVYGYYEHKDFLSLSAQMMNRDPGDWPVEELGNLMNNIRQFHGLPGMKILHAPSWYYWNSLVEEPKTFMVFRRPDACRKSIWRQRLFAWSLDWHTQNNIILGVNEQTEQSLVTSFERLLKRPEQVADKVEEELGIDVDPSVIDADQKSWDDTRVVAGDLENIVYEELKDLEGEIYGDEV